MQMGLAIMVMDNPVYAYAAVKKCLRPWMKDLSLTVGQHVHEHGIRNN